MSVTLDPMPLEVLDLLAAGDHVAAGRLLGQPVPPGFLDAQWVWQHFAALTRADPELAWWRTQYAVLDAGRIVGHVRLHSPDLDLREAQVGYHMEPLDRGRGLARAATLALLDLAAPRAEIDRVVALIAPENAASLAVARRCGFVDDGTQHHRYGWLMRRFVRPLDDVRG